ncbi:acetylornithine deacetylase, partial [Flavobacteriaceae bacterium]|nr:acetylornithine deacetylase [Flavobacteriaceae bacterium]
MEYIDTYEKEAIQLLKSLIETPSFSSEEAHTAKLIEAWFEQKGISYQQ